MSGGHDSILQLGNVLHTTVSWYMHALLENDWGHARRCVGVGDELSMIFSNIKDQAWSHYKHLHHYHNLKKPSINLRPRRIILQWWWTMVVYTSVKYWHTAESVGDQSKMSWRQEAARKLPCPTLQWKNGNKNHNMSSPHKVKYVSFD